MKRIEHVQIPVIAGLWPLASLRNAEFMNNEVPGCNVPEHIMQRMRRHAAAMEQLAVSRERNRMARDLHDTLAHSLSVETSPPRVGSRMQRIAPGQAAISSPMVPSAWFR